MYTSSYDLNNSPGGERKQLDGQVENVGVEFGRDCITAEMHCHPSKPSNFNASDMWCWFHFCSEKTGVGGDGGVGVRSSTSISWSSSEDFEVSEEDVNCFDTLRRRGFVGDCENDERRSYALSASLIKAE